ncbi:hypothetical protein [Synechococcus sp. PCC 7336]|uniref:hypothetical protein n=1 Tax=Synechococcus sp. PCC 7336 TaxID=195250 RepID=UPI0003829792|nr:hypothetical protein [Synechococcus sp. PCC 7336]
MNSLTSPNRSNCNRPSQTHRSDGARLSKWLLGGCLGAAILLGPAIGGWAQAAAQTVWRGNGQIVSGQGHGGRLELVVETSSGRIRTRSGPALDASFGGGSRTFQNSAGTWQIDRRGDRLNITLRRGSQVIRYQLTPDNKNSSAPRATVDKPFPFEKFDTEIISEIFGLEER